MSTDDPTDPREGRVARLLDDPAVWAEVPPGLRDRVVAAATESVATDPPDDRPDDLPPGRVAGGDVRHLPRHAARPGGPLGERRHRARRRPAILAAAAALVVALGVAGGLRLASDDTAPVRAEVALAGTDEAPSATATVLLRDQPAGVSVTLEVEGLEPAPEGTFYEAWLVGETGKVSAGTFHMRGDQDTVDLWLGVDPDGYEAVTVTRQPIAGGTTAEGVVVLQGELPAG